MWTVPTAGSGSGSAVPPDEVVDDAVVDDAVVDAVDDLAAAEPAGGAAALDVDGVTLPPMLSSLMSARPSSVPVFGS